MVKCSNGSLQKHDVIRHLTSLDVCRHEAQCACVWYVVIPSSTSSDGAADCDHSGSDDEQSGHDCRHVDVDPDRRRRLFLAVGSSTGRLGHGQFTATTTEPVLTPALHVITAHLAINDDNTFNHLRLLTQISPPPSSSLFSNQRRADSLSPVAIV